MSIRETPVASDQNAASEDAVVHEFEHDSDSLWSDNRALAIATLFGPLLLTAAVVGTIALIGGVGVAKRLVLTAFATFFVLGRFVILSGTESPGGLSPAELGLMVFYMDVMTAIVVSFHAGSLFRIPWLGKRLRVLMHDGHELLLHNHWMRRATLLGIIAFVMFPLASSGSVGGSMFGRLLGLSRMMTFFGVVVGSLLGCGTMYYGASFVNQHIDQDNFVVRWGGVLFIVALLALLNKRYHGASRSDENKTAAN